MGEMGSDGKRGIGSCDDDLIAMYGSLRLTRVKCYVHTPSPSPSFPFIFPFHLPSISIYTLNTPVLLPTPSNTHALSTGTYCSVTTLITS